MKTSGAWVLLLAVCVSSWGIWYYQQNKTEHVYYLRIKTTDPPERKSLLPEQRRKFALEFEKKFQDKGMDATVTTTGDFHTTMLIRGKVVNDPSVHRMMENVDAIKDLRGNGFRHLLMTNGNSTWDIDLKN
jgi:hypothetical protein